VLVEISKDAVHEAFDDVATLSETLDKVGRVLYEAAK
jgi:hypothetical protein